MSRPLCTRLLSWSVSLSHPGLYLRREISMPSALRAPRHAPPVELSRRPNRSRKRRISMQDVRFDWLWLYYINGHRYRLHSYGPHRNGYDEEHSLERTMTVSVRKSPEAWGLAEWLAGPQDPETVERWVQFEIVLIRIGHMEVLLRPLSEHHWKILLSKTRLAIDDDDHGYWFG